MKNGLDRNGYAPSIIPGHDEHMCWLCARNGNGKMDRHEVFGGAYRAKSKRLGLWVHLCHDDCHLNGVHKSATQASFLKAEAQREAMERYGWSREDFIREFGKNYILDLED